jgi:malate/lactate dehydrogenase
MQDEIERLKAMQRALKNKIKIIMDFDEKEMLQEQVDQLEKQIETLERFKPT